MTIEEIVQERQSYMPPTVEEALEWFPGASPVSYVKSPDRFEYSAREFAEEFPSCRKRIKENIKALNEDIRGVNEHIDNLRAKYHRFTDKPILENIVFIHEKLIIPLIESDLAWCKDVLFFLDIHKKPAQMQKFEHDVQVAKAVPITKFLEFNGAGKTHCLWHSERTPSMQYYPKENKVFCFGCNSGGDTIDVVSALYDKDFKDAVGFLVS